MAAHVLFPECCRCCLVEENDMVYVFDILDEFDSKICELIANSGGIRISEEDCFSKNICGNCLNDLANAARFRNRCVETERVLHNTSLMVDEIKQDTEERDVHDENSSGAVVFEQTDDDLSSVGLVKLVGDDLVEYSDDQSGQEKNPPHIQFIIAEDSSDIFDYENLISSQNSDLQEEDVQPVQHIVMPNDARLELFETDDELITKPKETVLNYVCQECGAGFAMAKNLAKHMASHQNFICDTCLVAFESKEELVIHQAEGHPEALDVTEKEYPQPSDLELRILGLNSDRKKHPCEFCGKSFVSNSALTSHVRVHTNERPFSCSFCPKRFRTVGAQELHERRHRGIKPYKCDVCGRGFAESSNLKVHRRTHTNEKPHVCTVCNRAFARVFLLKVHQRTHTGERPFPCAHCGRHFSQQGDLAAHRRIHTGERPHKCDVCGRGFIKSSGLVQHRRKKHEQSGGLQEINSTSSVGDLIGEYRRRSGEY